MEMIQTDNAPEAIGPYSQAVRVGNLLFCSGQIPIDPETGRMVDKGSAATQAIQVFRNIRAVLQAAGLEMKDVCKTTVYLSDIDNFKLVNAEYEKAFAGHKPARSTVEVSNLPLDALVEIECTAAFEN